MLARNGARHAFWAMRVMFESYSRATGFVRQESEEDVWGNYVGDAFALSPILVETLLKRRSWYGEEMVEQMQQSAWQVALLSAEERQQILAEWNQTQQHWPATASLMQQIAQQARQRGEAVAISEARQQLSYGELERRAEQLGQYLRQQGVR